MVQMECYPFNRYIHRCIFALIPFLSLFLQQHCWRNGKWIQCFFEKSLYGKEKLQFFIFKPNIFYTLRPLRPPFALMLSWAIGVTSSIVPIFIPLRANARIAGCAPCPGTLLLFAPGA